MLLINLKNYISKKKLTQIKQNFVNMNFFFQNMNFSAQFCELLVQPIWQHWRRILAYGLQKYPLL